MAINERASSDARHARTGKDAGYPQQDGKTPWSFTVA